MNNIERNKKNENNTITTIDKYRFNPENKVNNGNYDDYDCY